MENQGHKAMTPPSKYKDDLHRLIELGGAVAWCANGEIMGRMFAKEQTQPSKKSPWQFSVDKNTGCWQWLRAITPKGYANCHMKNETRAHRAYYRLLKGTIPEGLVVDHLCRNRGCVNPAHLRVITNKENLQGRRQYVRP
ncbi:hypothetical protein LCGC14_1215860 [marine sediment metagenome]|uniref:HNH nuclease domain-containing protein n=1 Tax=marine sediment metagenome TaxID=412755 RepID=A0A0F9NV12_9ZZZZ